MNEATPIEQLARMDAGEANQRILARIQYRADFRRVEAASLKRRVSIHSHEAKTALARAFMSLQESMYVISEVGRAKLTEEQVAAVEDSIRAKMDEIDKELNQIMDGAELLLRNQNIDTIASFDTKPLELEVSVISAQGRRYLDMILKLDRLIPLLATMGIWEVAKPREIAFRKSRAKRIVAGLASTARNLKLGMRRRMNEADAKRAEAEAAKAARAANKAVPKDSVDETVGDGQATGRGGESSGAEELGGERVGHEESARTVVAEPIEEAAAPAK